jgi:hypothetical protein
MAADTQITAECARLLDLIREKCPGVLPGAPLPSGVVGAAIDVNADQALKLFPAAASSAAGIDPFSTVPPPSVKWQEGDRELVIFPAKVTAKFANGVIAVSIPVSCDQTGDVVVFVSFVVGNPQQLAGLIATTSARPTGPRSSSTRGVGRWSRSRGTSCSRS